jgi:hypothetical protein
MGNAISYEIVGICRIQIKMYDGSVNKLTNVRHVPKLRNNLISLGVLYSGGYKCTVEGGVMKVSKGILLVMKAKRIENIYQLEGITESDQVAAVSKNVSVSTRLIWHQRLGHMSEKVLKVLLDHNLLLSLKSLKLYFCKHCIYEKHSRKNFKTGRHTSKGILDYIH